MNHVGMRFAPTRKICRWTHMMVPQAKTYSCSSAQVCFPRSLKVSLSQQLALHEGAQNKSERASENFGEIMQAFLSARQRAVDRHGKYGVWIVLQTIRAAGPTVSADELRDKLRDISIWLPDEEYTAMVQASSTSGSFDVDALVKQFIGDLPSRRKNVLQIFWERLDTERRCFVDLQAFLSAYDVSRHPDVLSNRQSASDVYDKFAQMFTGGSHSNIFAKEELFALYAGVSLRTERNEEFELLIMRSFSLDRPRVASAAAHTTVAASSAASSAAGSLKSGRVHPLYQTSASLVGKECDAVEAGAPKKFNRTGDFTKHAPPFSGPSGLNTSISRSRV